MKTLLAAPSTPYKGLAPYIDSDLDAFLFFGRERDRDVIVANLIAARLTVLYGASGVGKSSVLRAGVAYRLREVAHEGNGGPEHAVAVVDAWAGDPIDAILETVDASREETLARSLEAWTQQHDATLYLILDQFEEYFVYHGDDDGGPLRNELADVLTDRALRVNLLFSLREDALAQLDAFKGRIPNLLANSLRLDRLDRRAARAAIVGPVEHYNELVPEDTAVAIEPELVEAVLDEVTLGRVDLGTAGRGEVRTQEGGTGIEAPYLQLVMERLWEAERAESSRVLRPSTLRRLGGAVSIVSSHLERALDTLTPEQRDIAASVFNHLVTPSGTKIAHRAGDLAQYASMRESDLVPVLGTLGRERIVRAVDGAGSGAARYEIFHDVLGDAVLAWRARHETERRLEAARRQHRRALRLAAIAAFGLAAMTAVAVYAVVQRHDARTSERKARARAFVAESLAQLDLDPQRSLELALRAAGLERTPQVERQLRRALGDARLREAVRVREPIVSAEYAPDGSLFVAGRRGTVIVLRRAHGPDAFHVGPGLVSIAKIDKSGRRLIVAEGTDARVVDTETGRTTLMLHHRTNVTSVSFLPGDRILTGTFGGSLLFWRARDGGRLTTLRQPGPVRRATLAPGGRSLAVAAADRTGHVRTRLYHGLRLVRVLSQIGISDAEFNSKGDVLATSSRDGSTILWSAATGRRLRTLDDGGGAVSDVAFSPDGSWLATANSDAVVRVWDVATGQRTFFFVAHSGPDTGVAFDPSGAYLVSTSEDRTARVWQLIGPGTGRQVALLAPHGGVVGQAAFAPDGKALVTTSVDGTARIWDARFEQQLNVLARVNQTVAAAAFVPGGIVDVVGNALEMRGKDGVVRRRVIGNGPFALGPRGTLASASGRTIAVEQLRSRATLRLPAPVAALAFGGDGRELVAVGTDNRVVTWQLPSGRVVERLRVARGATSVAISPQHGMVAIGSDDGVVRLYAADGRLVHALHGHASRVIDLRFDPSGTRLVSASAGSHDNALVWNVRRGTMLHALVGHFGDVTAASFSSDGRWILTAGPISAGIWPSDTGLLLFYLRGPTDLLTDAEWSSRGYRVVTSARDGTVRTYTCEVCRPLDGLVALAEKRLAATD